MVEIAGHAGHNIKGINLGEKNGQWKGDKVTKRALHDYIKYYLIKPELCECCHERKAYDLANISQEYKRDFSDWEWLCRHCHMTKDGRLKKLAEFPKGNKYWMNRQRDSKGKFLDNE